VVKASLICQSLELKLLSRQRLSLSKLSQEGQAVGGKRKRKRWRDC
jgi:hypothetical protein